MSNDGFKDLSRKLNKMQKAAKKLSGTHSVDFNKLFPGNFMQRRTNYSSIDAFLAAAGINSQEDLEAKPDTEMDAFVRKSSSFQTWQEMLDTASNDYISKKLGF
ncbi:MAG: hypothetical protein ABF743_14395 [Schleiferilactobacillus perolens]|uniref:hypothetical protein n=1 Tax=Schleiferilactobacillus perolens TaxID=100468 RepID=UPI0039EC5B2F